MEHLYRALFSKPNRKSTSGMLKHTKANPPVGLAKFGLAFYPLILFVLVAALAYWLVNVVPQASIDSPFVASTHALLLLGAACLMVLRQWVKKG